MPIPSSQRGKPPLARLEATLQYQRADKSSKIKMPMIIAKLCINSEDRAATRLLGDPNTVMEKVIPPFLIIRMPVPNNGPGSRPAIQVCRSSTEGEEVVLHGMCPSLEQPMRVSEVDTEQRRNAKTRVNVRFPRKPADQCQHGERFPSVKIREWPCRGSSLFASAGGKRSSHWLADFLRALPRFPRHLILLLLHLQLSLTGTEHLAVKAPASLELFPTFQAEKRWSDKGGVARRIKCTIASAQLACSVLVVLRVPSGTLRFDPMPCPHSSGVGWPTCSRRAAGPRPGAPDAADAQPERRTGNPPIGRSHQSFVKNILRNIALTYWGRSVYKPRNAAPPPPHDTPTPECEHQDIEAWRSFLVLCSVIVEHTSCLRLGRKSSLETPAGEAGETRENPPASAIVQHDSHMQKSGGEPAGYRARFAVVGGERPSHCATAVPAVTAAREGVNCAKRPRACYIMHFGRRRVVCSISRRLWGAAGVYCSGAAVRGFRGRRPPSPQRALPQAAALGKASIKEIGQDVLLQVQRLWPAPTLLHKQAQFVHRHRLQSVCRLRTCGLTIAILDDDTTTILDANSPTHIRQCQFTYANSS
ncbi:hypothetical protein PR048_025522 [Dryococelus australis]|uniref:Uncharacterized protein n=1 Tax=Dryococelus australis TaxID=614101 RepID=A0ABQ9GRL8_9NEOP|nr:hypothetical protein PR048_025522 [Dryococelus australis]